LVKFLKSTQQEKILESSTKILNERLKEFNLPSIAAKDSKINQLYDKKELEKKLIEAADNRLIYNDIIK
jgi:hypothetical protein